MRCAAKLRVYPGVPLCSISAIDLVVCIERLAPLDNVGIVVMRGHRPEGDDCLRSKVESMRNQVRLTHRARSHSGRRWLGTRCIRSPHLRDATCECPPADPRSCEAFCMVCQTCSEIAQSRGMRQNAGHHASIGRAVLTYRPSLHSYKEMDQQREDTAGSALCRGEYRPVRCPLPSYEHHPMSHRMPGSDGPHPIPSTSCGQSTQPCLDESSLPVQRVPLSQHRAQSRVPTSNERALAKR